ncbi:hypothetical protein PV08_02779 [Exophiala spinifera]|uniref:Mediator of RNA polymerase II transcription subunit 4 n=1 Tax=Exophiala spinifera TaxID=91928 RepID=A0A0D1YT82_9EURO|nr:uncharacterized protein PV08_02779 [Exophiala spinifera]KIW18491.1 hypothetical protein PV08_02779 [Exophiala spinifera]
MDSLVLSPLNSIENHLNALVANLTQTNTFNNAPPLAKDLVTDDDNLSASLTLLRKHQQNYARLLNLRAEVEDLQTQLQDTIRRSVAFREEILQIHPAILDDSDDEEDSEENHVAEIDYHTLLAFAARIGKHNAAAAREAEAEAVRRKVAAKREAANGAVDGEENATAETEAELERINNTVAQTRAQMGMSFPDANLLRVGALGQLQLYQERQAAAGGNTQDALDREVERLVRETENIAEAVVEPAENTATEEGLGWTSPELARRTLPGSSGQAGPAHGSSQASMSQQAKRPGGEAPPKRKVALDFPGSDDDEDDDD